MFEEVSAVRLSPIMIEFPPGTMISLYPPSWASLIAFSCVEFAVVEPAPNVTSTPSIEETSTAEAPVPLNRRTGSAAGIAGARTTGVCPAGVLHPLERRSPSTAVIDSIKAGVPGKRRTQGEHNNRPPRFVDFMLPTDEDQGFRRRSQGCRKLSR